ncbi:MAG: hypothetical protein Q9227_005241, partial [Pyrenula ochraceoflavens]
MGQGYSMTTLSAGSANIDTTELADLTYEKSLGTARFMKSIRARHHQGLAFVKAILKPFPSMKLEKYSRAIKREREALTDVPNVLTYQRIIENATSGYLVRQYIHSSLYDRMSTRPFLEDIEKKWLAFQLLSALRECHARQIYHGDIKTENVLVTSWNWLCLTDFSSSFKPLFLPEDNPADFSFFFDKSGRRTCYLAPERFLAPGEDPKTKETMDGEPDPLKMEKYMDIFSAGCVIAELFLEGPIFTLSQLFKYRRGEYSLEHTQLNKIEDKDVKELILHMIQIDPNDRFSAEQYLDLWRRRTFPEYFYSFLHQYMSLMTEPSPGRLRINLESANEGEPDERIDRVYHDFDKISYFLGYGDRAKALLGPKSRWQSRITLPMPLALDNQKPRPESRSNDIDDGTLIFLTLVATSLRNTSRAASRIRACDLMLIFAERLSDEIKLDRVIPYLVTLLNDRADGVKVAALRSLTELLATVEVVSPVNAYIFPEYIFPKLKTFVIGPAQRPSSVVRAAYATCIASLAHSSSKILNILQAIQSDHRWHIVSDNEWALGPAYHGLFDVARNDLLSHFEDHTTALLTDPDPSVRRAFLGSVSALCVFFGSARASDVILTHLNTYLNDSDWILRCAFFDSLVGVATYVGSCTLEEFVLPLMVQSLTDPEDFVLERVLRSFANIAQLALFRKPTTWRLLDIVVRFMIHPSIWVREAAVHFAVATSLHVNIADKYSIIMPALQPLLKIPIADITETEVLDALKKPLLKSVLEMAITWAQKPEKGAFWKTATRDKVFNIEEPDGAHRPAFLERRSSTRIPASQMSQEDEQWLSKLRGLGMSQEDDMKLMALKEYVWRLAHQQSRDMQLSSVVDFSSVIPLNQINVTPQTVIFENPLKVKSPPGPPERRSKDNFEKPQTVADALLDASTTIENVPSKRRKAQSKRMSQNGTQSSLPKQINSSRRGSGQGPSPYGSSPGVGPESEASSVPSSDVDPSRTPRKGAFGSLENEMLKGKKRNDSDIALRHRASAINLLRKDLAKADAATAMDSATAFGKVDGSGIPHRPSEPSPLALASRTKTREEALQRRPLQPFPASRDYHSYAGSDPMVLNLLDNVFAENFPTDLLEFRPIVTPFRGSIKKGSELSASAEGAEDKKTLWRPDGTLLALFGEHTSIVNRVCVAPDHAFFVTASDDSTVKIWDTLRLEKNITPRSRQTHRHAAGASVKALCFIEDTHTFVSGATDGSIHAVRVDYHNLHGETTRYGRPQLVRECYLSQIAPSRMSDDSSEPAEHAVDLVHYRSETSGSLLFVLTNWSNLHCLDLKTMKNLYTLVNPIYHGIPTSFCIDRRRNWLLIGTSHGILDLWDLRFHVRVKSWGLSGGTPIHRLHTHPRISRQVFVAGGLANGEVTVWDVDRTLCRDVFRTVGDGSTSSKDVTQMKTYEPWYPDDSPSSLLDRFASATAANGAVIDPFDRQSGGLSSAKETMGMAIGVDVHMDHHFPFLLTGGSDRKVRLWDTERPENSMMVSGSDTTTENSISVRYELAHPDGQINIVTEKSRMKSSSGETVGAASGKEGKGVGARELLRTPRNTIIAQQQRQLLRSHLDGVTDVAFLGKPYGMVISVDCMGCV